MTSKSACNSESPLYAAYKKVVARIAEDLKDVDVRTIQYTEDLKSDPTSKHLALDLLECLEKKGAFSYHNIEPLEAILSSVNRCDLITKHVDDFKRQYGQCSRRSAAMQGKFVVFFVVHACIPTDRIGPSGLYSHPIKGGEGVNFSSIYMFFEVHTI